ncbi:hypothetical protein M5K25_008569 [Dendrobium thyrsiflorum]|uniref:Uncharacterized protein n=1 Tax=Dendrobium thyrsiflorum TaxID=117978 RepID=A0ABD0VFW3_DENTH
MVLLEVTDVARPCALAASSFGRFLGFPPVLASRRLAAFFTQVFGRLIVLVYFLALGARMGDAANPWGVAASSASAKPQGFFNLGSEISKSPSRSFKEVVSGNTSAGDSISSLAHSSMNEVPAILLSDEEVLKLASPFQFTLVAATNNNIEVNGDKEVTNGIDNRQDMARNINEKAVEPNLYLSVDSMLQNISDINDSPTYNAPPCEGAPSDHMEGGTWMTPKLRRGNGGSTTVKCFDILGISSSFPFAGASCDKNVNIFYWLVAVLVEPVVSF